MNWNRKRWIAAALALLILQACAAGPRWVAGPQWQNAGQIMNWYRPDVQYFVDAGPLSSSVNNAAAVSLINAAAAVWNVPSVAFTLKNGGALSEDVSSTNVYLGSNGPVFPSDVQSSNYTAKQIAIVLDADGTITDMLLGSGASDPSNCRQNAVTENVDLFIQPGKVAHAVIILNGRCTGPAPEQQQQLQYQLMREFGRVIGLGWSQTNDNVFTYASAPTAEQLMHWPVMHPIDIICGPYTYQCMLSPFTLRVDDIAALGMVYATNTRPVNTLGVSGVLTFPTGEGMNGVNMVARRGGASLDQFEEVSNVSGYLSSGDDGNAVSDASTDTQGVLGYANGNGRGYYNLFGIPALAQYDVNSFVINTAPVNPLYVGTYAIGPYRTAQVLPSGGGLTLSYIMTPGSYWYVDHIPIADAANQCNALPDGTESAPAAIPSEGEWTGRLCPVGHTAWSTFAVKAGRTASLEVTALDEQLSATGSKAMPVIGLWNASDATGQQPTLGATPTALNTSHTGLTQLSASFSTAGNIRMAIVDQRGDGRPDFNYSARLLYADTVTPTRMPASGGTVRILGTGFHQGNTVTIGGVLAQVSSITANEIDAVAPTSTALNGKAVNDVVITDLATGGTASILGGLIYSGASTDVLTLVQSPISGIALGLPQFIAFKVTDANGQPVKNAAVALSVSGANTLITACQLAACTLLTDATGTASAAVNALTLGAVSLNASINSGSSVTATWNVLPGANVIGFTRPVQYVAAGSGAIFNPGATVMQSGAAVIGQGIAWSTTTPQIALANATGMSSTSGTSTVKATGTLLDNQSAQVQACAWTIICATETVIGVAPANLGVTVTSGDAQSVKASATLGAITTRIVDTAGHPVAGASIVVYQAVYGWQTPCTPGGRCPPPPMYGSSSTPTVSDDDGNITVTPMQYPNTAGVTKITVTAGTQGTATITLQKTP